MIVIISFAGLEDRQEILKSRRPFPLQPLAGSTILGHILERLQNVAPQTIIVVVSAGGEQVNEWVQQLLPEGYLQVVTVEDANNPLIAMAGCEQFLDSEPVLFVSGEFVTEADYDGLNSYGVDVVCLVQDGQEMIPAENNRFVGDTDLGEVSESHWGGACWFRRGKDLWTAADCSTDGETGIGALLSFLKGQGLKITTVKAGSCLGTGSPDQILHTNARLMQLGYCSEDAIERSYSEEFTVLPPVFLHETAVVDNAVIGPFVNLEEDAVVRNSVVSNSFIGCGAQVIDIVLNGSFIGDRAKVIGHKQAVIVGDESRLKLD